jgi:hypothetical protein
MTRFVPLVLGVLGCFNNEGGSVDGSSDAVAEGVVTRASGSPVASATLFMLVVDSITGETIFNEAGASTDASGHFSRVLAAFLTAPFTGRVQITVQPATDQLADSIVDAGFLRFGRQPPETSTTVITYP